MGFDGLIFNRLYTDTRYSEKVVFVHSVNYCDRSMPVVRRALKAHTSYTPEPVDSKLDTKYRGDL